MKPIKSGNSSFCAFVFIGIMSVTIACNAIADDFVQVTINVLKNEYYSGEPIWVEVSCKNTSSKEIILWAYEEIYPPLIIKNENGQIRQGGGLKEYSMIDLTLTNAKTGIRKPYLILPDSGAFIFLPPFSQSKKIFYELIYDFYGQMGKGIYTIETYYKTPPQNEYYINVYNPVKPRKEGPLDAVTIESKFPRIVISNEQVTYSSKPVTFRIIEPTGLEKEAYQLLQKAADANNNIMQGKKVEQKPKDFYQKLCDKYPSSVYADLSFYNMLMHEAGESTNRAIMESKSYINRKSKSPYVGKIIDFLCNIIIDREEAKKELLKIRSEHKDDQTIMEKVDENIYFIDKGYGKWSPIDRKAFKERYERIMEKK